jgi:hypothetical protein
MFRPQFWTSSGLYEHSQVIKHVGYNKDPYLLTDYFVANRSRPYNTKLQINCMLMKFCVDGCNFNNLIFIHNSMQSINIINVFSSSNLKDQFWYPHKIINKFIILNLCVCRHEILHWMIISIPQIYYICSFISYCNCFKYLCMHIFIYGRSRWSRGVKYEPSSPARTLGSWVRIPL